MLFFFLFSLSSNGWPTQEKSLENRICSSRNTLFISLLSISNQFSCLISSSRKLLRIKVTPDLHLTYSKNGENLGLVLNMKIIACLSILLTKHVKYTYLYLFKFVLYNIVTIKAN